VTTAGSVQELQDELLRQTFEWCRAQSSFYRERFSGVDALSGRRDLARLPVLFRQDVVENHQALRCDPTLPSAIQHTTGTTGEFLQLYRSAAEQAFIWEFFSAQLQANEAEGLRPLCMNLINIYHGSLISVPSRTFVLPVGVFDQAQVSQAKGVLERSYDLPGVEPRVSILSGTERMVMALTAYLMAEGMDLAASPVKTIALFGGHVPPSRKALLGRLWNARVRDQYSLTEMFGGARECGPGGPWVFDPHVVPEVVHPRTLEPVSSGLGVLLLTSLYPFVQQMPLIRYSTGDLVEIVTPAEDPAGLTARYAGRAVRSVVDDSGPEVVPLLLSGPLYEALIDLPDIAISPRFTDLPVGAGLELTGDLHYAVDHVPATDGSPEEISLRIGLRYEPWMYPDRVAEVVDRLVEALFRRHPALARRCVERTMVLKVLPLSGEAVPPHDSK